MPSNPSDRYAACPKCDAYEGNSGHPSKRAGRLHTSNSAAPDTTLSIFSTIPSDNQTAAEQTPVSSADALKNKGPLFHGSQTVSVTALAVISSPSVATAYPSAFEVSHLGLGLPCFASGCVRIALKMPITTSIKRTSIPITISFILWQIYNYFDVADRRGYKPRQRRKGSLFTKVSTYFSALL